MFLVYQTSPYTDPKINTAARTHPPTLPPKEQLVMFKLNLKLQHKNSHNPHTCSHNYCNTVSHFWADYSHYY